MKKSKLTYRNELTFTLGDTPRNYLRLQHILSDADIGEYCARVFMNNVKCPKGTAFGGQITKDEPRLLECTILEQTNGYAGKVVFVNPIIA